MAVRQCRSAAALYISPPSLAPPSPPAPTNAQRGGRQQAGLGRPSAQKQDLGPWAALPSLPGRLCPCSLWDTPSPATLWSTQGAPGPPGGQRGPLPTPPQGDCRAAVLAPHPEPAAPGRIPRAPQQFHWARLGCHRSGIPEGLSPAVPGVTGDACLWRHLLAVRSGSSPPAGWTQLTAAGPVTRRGPVPPWPAEAERGVCGQDGGAASGPRPGAVQCPVHRSRLAGCRRTWGPGLRSVRGRLPRPPGGARGQGGP